MKAEFGELQFAYAITREIEDRIIFSGLNLGIPSLPNLRKEGECGFDVAFEGPVVTLFLQYKLPEKLTRNYAREWADMGEKPYYRISIYPADRSAQHNLLAELARKSRRNQVYYCAPAFTDYQDMTDFQKCHMVSAHSVFVNCYGLPYIEGKEEHCICYQRDSDSALMYSQPENVRLEQGWKTVLEQSRQYTYDNMDEFLWQVLDMEDIPRTRKERSAKGEQEEEQVSLGRRLDTLTRVGNYFAREGIQLLLLKK